MSKVTQYKKAITEQMDVLQQMMEDNVHLENPQQVINQIDEISFKWTFVSEEDREYIQFARHAIEEQLRWNV